MYVWYIITSEEIQRVPSNRLHDFTVGSSCIIVMYEIKMNRYSRLFYIILLYYTQTKPLSVRRYYGYLNVSKFSTYAYSAPS